MSKLKRDSYLTETYNPELTLTDWVVATTYFYNYYQSLVTCIVETTTKYDFGIEDVCIGQCPLSLLSELINTMEEELKKLGWDMAQTGSPEPTSIGEHYEKLALHTQVLRQLNQQAQDVLHLSCLQSKGGE